MKAASVILIEGVPMDSSAAPYTMIARFPIRLVRGRAGSSRQSKVRADVAKFTDITPTVLLGKSL